MRNQDELWNNENNVSDYTDVPAWIDQDITVYDLMAIQQGGCASGAYMPAVTYHQAAATMAEHGDTVLEYICDGFGELPQTSSATSWAGIAVFYLSIAVELWASSAIAAIEEQVAA